MFLNHLYGRIGEPEIKVLDTFVYRVRKKLAAATRGDHYIETEWGGGYVLRDPDAPPQPKLKWTPHRKAKVIKDVEYERRPARGPCGSISFQKKSSWPGSEISRCIAGPHRARPGSSNIARRTALDDADQKIVSHPFRPLPLLAEFAHDNVLHQS
jgi:hypothetical protein